MSERDELAQAIYDLTGLRGEAWTVVSDIASEYELADSLLARGYRRSVTPGDVEAAANKIDPIAFEPCNMPNIGDWEEIPKRQTILARQQKARDAAGAAARVFGLSVAEDGGQ